MEDGIISSQEMMAKLFSNFAPQIESSNRVVDAWQRTVSKINGCGKQIAAHTKVIDLKDGVLEIETSHPSWSQLLQLHSTFILKGLSFLVPDMDIKTLIFRNGEGKI